MIRLMFLQKLYICKRCWQWLASISLLLLLLGCAGARKQAEQAERKGEYLLASTLYTQLYKRTPSRQRELKAYYAMHAADGYRSLRQWTKALNLYRNAERYGYPDSIILLRIGQALQMSGQYRQADEYYNRYRAVDSLSYFARIGSQGCAMAISDSTQSSRYIVRKAEGWNSGASDYAPCFSPDGSTLYVGSSRGRDGDKSQITGEVDGNIYGVTRDQHGLWGVRLDTLSGALNTDADEGTPSLTSDGNIMYYTYSEQSPHYQRTAQIWQASKSGDRGWSKGTLVDIWRDSTMMAAHPAITPSGTTLFFVSDVPGGFGGKDLYRVQLEGGAFGIPENLGLPINTPGDELFPYCQSDSVIYFASDGHIGYGGLDIYQATLLPSGQWHLEVLPKPINSAADDYGFVLDPSVKVNPNEVEVTSRGLFASSRDDGRGRPNLYHFTLPKAETIIEGFVMDREGYPIVGAMVRLVGDYAEDAQFVAQTKDDGSYRIKARANASYVMLASASGYLNQYAKFRTEPSEQTEYYGIDFRLASRLLPESLPYVHYAFDSAELLPEAQSSLDELISILNDNPDIKIELSSHADRHGVADYNQKLSDRRAESAMNYLLKRGIEASRVRSLGYGQRKPVVVTERIAERYDFLKQGDTLTLDFVLALNAEEQDICDRLNRRTEFVVLE